MKDTVWSTRLNKKEKGRLLGPPRRLYPLITTLELVHSCKTQNGVPMQLEGTYLNVMPFNFAEYNNEIRTNLFGWCDPFRHTFGLDIMCGNIL